MKTHSETLLSCFLAICMAISAAGTSAWAQTEAAYTQATYFTFRTEQLQQELKLTPAQMQQLKPIVEQETAELMQFACNPSTSPNEKLSQFTGVFKRSESAMRPILTGEQLSTVVKLRQAMLQDYKTRKPADSCTLAYWGRKTADK
jgi:hypothetical protein